MKYKLIGTEQDLFDNGFVVYSKDFPYETGGYPLIGRATRDNIKIFTSMEERKNDTNLWIDKENEITFAYSHLENMPKRHYIQLNIFYDNYSQKELERPYAIQDLIDLGYVEVVE